MLLLFCYFTYFMTISHCIDMFIFFSSRWCLTLCACGKLKSVAITCHITYPMYFRLLYIQPLITAGPRYTSDGPKAPGRLYLPTLVNTIFQSFNFSTFRPSLLQVDLHMAVIATLSIWRSVYRSARSQLIIMFEKIFSELGVKPDPMSLNCFHHYRDLI